MKDREDFLEDEEEGYVKTNADEEVRVKSVNVIVDNVTALSKLLIAPKEERETILQLLIVKVEDSRVIKVQPRFKTASGEEESVQPVI